MAEAFVEFDAVSKAFDSLVAVDRVSLSVKKGQTLGLIGPNGAGKTTLLRMLSSLAKPDSGDVRVNGQSVRTCPRAVRRILGFMPAEFGSPKNVSIGEYLEFFGCTYDIPLNDRQRRIREVCELTELTGREDVMVNGLSTGNRQRLLLAKTLLHDPELLVLDEPASGLDPRARTELRAIVKTLASLGKTIIISSHILPDIEDISDQIGILEAGRLVLDGHLSELRTRQAPTETMLRLRVPAADSDRTTAILNRLHNVLGCDVRDQHLIVRTREANGNPVLAELLKHEIHIIEFAEDEPNLEDIFMQTTAGKVT